MQVASGALGTPRIGTSILTMKLFLRGIGNVPAIGLSVIPWVLDIEYRC